MKLPDFVHSAPLNRLRRLMGAELGRFTLARSPNLLTPAEIEQLAQSGIELTLDQLRILNDGTLAYKDSRVVLCLSKVTLYPGRDGLPGPLPAFHVADCRQLQAMRAATPQQLVVASTREDRSFALKLGLKDSGEVELCRQTLSVCLDCLGRLCWQDFHPSLSAREGRAVAAKFSLGEYFNAYRKALPRRSKKLIAAARHWP